jgi:ABC-type nickel/cobalt efflux system permease component RcnA
MLASTAVVTLLWLLAAPAALAHPLGSPAFALLEQTGARTLDLTWTPAPDDWVVLARHLDVDVGDRWPDPVPIEATLAPDEQVRLADAPALSAYLTDHLVVEQDGRRCPSQVTVPPRLDDGSPTVHLTCPQPLTSVDVTITALLSIDARYRTTLVAPTEKHDARVAMGADVPTATVDLEAGTAAPRVSADPLGGALGVEQRLTRAMTGASSVWTTAVLLVLALGVGAAHALAPGHGKTIAAAYLVGARGRSRDAAALGIAVALMHTASVLVLAAVLWGASSRLDLTSVSTGLQFAAGVAVATVGTWLVWRGRRGAHGHGVADGRAHEHDHDHVHATPGHDHAPPTDPDGRTLSWPRLIALATAGGLLPSPTAVVVLLTALTLGRTGLGLAAVGAFSIGLAATLTVIGLGVVWGQRRLADLGGAWSGRILRLAPVAGGIVVAVLGAAVAVRAVW